MQTEIEKTHSHETQVSKQRNTQTLGITRGITDTHIDPTSTTKSQFK